MPMSPLPPGLVINGFKRGKVIPFLGAGASIVEILPDESKSIFPTGRELASEISINYCGFNPSDPGNEQFHDLAFATSYLENITGTREDLTTHLADLFRYEARPGRIHRFLARLETPTIIFTTNFDDLIERAFDEAGKPYDLLIYPSSKYGTLGLREAGSDTLKDIKPNDFNPTLENTVIFKMHGTYDRKSNSGRYVISEEDYTEFLSTMPIPEFLKAHMRRRRFLFLGYGLADWNFRVVLHNIGTFGKGRLVEQDEETQEQDDEAKEQDAETQRSWAVMRNPSEHDVRLWDRKNVMVADVDIDEAAKSLSQAMFGDECDE